jgi:hypothetical protein
MTGKFRVWCKDHNEWEKDLCVLMPGGSVCHARRNGELVSLRPESHIAEFYTPVTDKNDRRICVGDICQVGDEKLEVYFDDELCEFGFRNSHELFQAQFGHEFEVIGNIHEKHE